MKKLKGSLGFKIVLTIFTVMMVSNLAVGVMVYKQTSGDLQELMYQDLLHSVSAVANDIDLYNQKEFRMLETFALLPEIRSNSVSLYDKTRIVRKATEIDKSYVDVSILDINGNAYMEEEKELASFADRDYFKKPALGTPYVSEPFRNKITGQIVMIYSYPVKDLNGRVINVLVSIVDGFRLSELCVKHPISKNRMPYIISSDTYLTIANAEQWKVAFEDIKQIKDANKGTQLADHLDRLLSGNKGYDSYEASGSKWLSAYEKVPGTSWIVACSVPFADFEDKVIRLARNIASVFAFMTVLSLLLCALVVSMSIKPLRGLKDAIVRIASGNADLSSRIEVKSNDEIGEVVKGFNGFTEKLQSIVSRIKNSEVELSTAGSKMSGVTEETAASITEIIANIESVNNQIVNQSSSVEETAGAVNRIASNINSLERMIENQVSGVVQASAAVEQMIGNIASVNRSVEKMAQSFAELDENVKTGSEKQTDVNDRVEQIKQQSDMLQDANTAIANIASQTNLLAMNAAIEAAHAGEAGKGFSVVADEIRKLSETAGLQSKTIGVQLDKIKESIDGVVSASLESSDSFKKVTDKITETDELVHQIKNAMEEQNEGSRQIGSALNTMNDSTAEVRTASAEMSSGNQAILQQIQRLQSATVMIKESVGEMSLGAKKINETGASLSDISNEMKSSIKKIGVEIDLFEV